MGFTVERALFLDVMIADKLAQCVVTAGTAIAEHSRLVHDHEIKLATGGMVCDDMQSIGIDDSYGWVVVRRDYARDDLPSLVGSPFADSYIEIGVDTEKASAPYHFKGGDWRYEQDMLYGTVPHKIVHSPRARESFARSDLVPNLMPGIGNQILSCLNLVMKRRRHAREVVIEH
jgi:methyl coenzyme M reductase gamma subunit